MRLSILELQDGEPNKFLLRIAERKVIQVVEGDRWVLARAITSERGVDERAYQLPRVV